MKNITIAVVAALFLFATAVYAASYSDEADKWFDKKCSKNKLSGISAAVCELKDKIGALNPGETHNHTDIVARLAALEALHSVAPTTTIILFEDFEDLEGFTTEGSVTGYWGLAPLEGTFTIPSNFSFGGSQSGNIFYGSFAKDFSDLDAAPSTTISLPDLTGYTNLELTVALAAPDCTISTCWEITHRDRLEINGDSDLIDIFLPSSGASTLSSQVSGRDLHYDFQDYSYTIDTGITSLSFVFASTDYDEVVGIDSVKITGIPN